MKRLLLAAVVVGVVTCATPALAGGPRGFVEFGYGGYPAYGGYWAPPPVYYPPPVVYPSPYVVAPYPFLRPVHPRSYYQPPYRRGPSWNIGVRF